MQAQGATNAQITDLRKTLTEAQFRMSMGEEKIHAILKCHKLNTSKIVTESMDKSWKTWSVQAAELQLLRADMNNHAWHSGGSLLMTPNG